MAPLLLQLLQERHFLLVIVLRRGSLGARPPLWEVSSPDYLSRFVGSLGTRLDGLLVSSPDS